MQIWPLKSQQLTPRTATGGAGRAQFEPRFFANFHDTQPTLTLIFALPGGRSSLRVSASESIAAAALLRGAAGQWRHPGVPISRPT